MWTYTFRRTLFVLLLSLAWAQAATITVTTTTDVTANDGQCSLREAIAAANSQTASGDAQGECVAGSDGPNTVVVPEGTYNLGSTLTIDSDIRINGAGMNETLIDGGNSVRVLYLLTGNRLTLDGVRILGGSTGGSGAGLYMETGSFASIENSRFSANTANNHGGAVNLDKDAFIDIKNSIFTNNSANFGGAIYSYFGAVTIEDTTLTTNTATYDGGAIFTLSGFVSIKQSEISNNSSESGGGLFANNSSNAQLDDVTFNNNTVTYSGGGIYLKEYSLLGMTGGEVSNNKGSQGAGLHLLGSSAKLDSVIITNNSASDEGGGLYLEASFAHIKDSGIDTNTAGTQGGGFFSYYPSSLWLMNTDLVANHSINEGGGGYGYDSQIFMRDGRISDNTSNYNGAGLFLEGTATHLERIAVINNQADENGGGLSLTHGSNMVLRNSTVSGNKASSGSGGGIFVSRSALELSHSTVTDNEASTKGGGIHNRVESSFAYHASVIAGNKASDDEDCFIDSPALSRGHNVTGNDTGCVSDSTDLSISSDAVFTVLLMPLADNGGPTPTHALRTGSLADNAADNDYCPLTDQRGIARMQNNFDCDIGAFERVNESPSDASSGKKKKSGSLPGWGLGIIGLLMVSRRRWTNEQLG